MAKKSMIERDKKRQKLILKYAAKRADLKAQRKTAVDFEQKTSDSKSVTGFTKKQFTFTMAQPLFSDGSSERVFPSIWIISSCFTRNGKRGITSWGYKIKLVTL